MEEKTPNLSILPDDVLEGLAAGEFTPMQTGWLDGMITLYKNAGLSLDDMIAYNHGLQHVPASIVAEMDEYVRSHW